MVTVEGKVEADVMLDDDAKVGWRVAIGHVDEQVRRRRGRGGRGGRG